MHDDDDGRGGQPCDQLHRDRQGDDADQGRAEKSDRSLLFRPSGPLGNVVALHGTLKIIQFGRCSVAGIDAEFDIPRFEFARLVYGLPAGQVIDHQDVRLLTEFYGITHAPAPMHCPKHIGAGPEARSGVEKQRAVAHILWLVAAEIDRRRVSFWTDYLG